MYAFSALGDLLEFLNYNAYGLIFLVGMDGFYVKKLPRAE